MSLNIEKLQEELCHHLCAEIKLIRHEGYVMVTTPFCFPDGDRYVMYLEEQSGGKIKLTDSGHTLMHLSYENDVDKFFTGTRGKIFKQVLASGKVFEKNGAIYIESSPDQLGMAVFRLSQTLISINNLTFLNRERVESTFYEDLDKMVEKFIVPEKVQKHYIHKEMDKAEIYPIDYRIEGKNEPLFLFGMANSQKALLSTIVLEHFKRNELQFDSVLIAANKRSISRADRERLMNAGGEIIYSTEDEDSFKRIINDRVA